jgi:hypothetical protein
MTAAAALTAVLDKIASLDELAPHVRSQAFQKTHFRTIDRAPRGK